jgi:threonyl-tRNA synthetase
MSEMFQVRLPDGSVREVEPGTTPADIAAAIGPGLAKAALAARVNGELRDLKRPFEEDAELALITARDEAEALELVRHDYAHVLAEAVQNLFPGTQITFGPATDDGFYYDFAPPPERGPFTEEDLPAIEEEMRRVIAKDAPLIREVWTRDQVRDFFERSGETFKAQWVMELPADETITMYRSGDWVDLCRGPHLASTGKLDPQAFKLTRVSGAYWRGDQKNAMLSRIYGTGRAGSIRSSSTRTSRGSRRRPSATTGRSARTWTSSTSRRKRTDPSSGTPRAISSGGSSKPICAGGWTPQPMTR